jgi:hypothetical protein
MAGRPRIGPLPDAEPLAPQPLIDAWMEFSSEWEERRAWTPDLEARAQAVRDAMAKLSVDRDSAMKMLREGI